MFCLRDSVHKNIMFGITLIENDKMHERIICLKQYNQQRRLRCTFLSHKHFKYNYHKGTVERGFAINITHC